MNSREAIRLNLDQAENIAKMYLGDLSDADLLVRPVPGCNHIAWQLGHLIEAERSFVDKLQPGIMPALPAGFAAKHTKETAGSDDPKAFLTKQQYLELAVSVRATALTALEKTSDAQLDQPPPAEFADFTRSVGDLLSMIGTHWTMHTGQWAVIRRKLGRTPLF
jgi:uncharacterized damage-inducible protein DinB